MVKSHLIFLHGALGCNKHWERFLPYFYEKFEVHNLNFPAHGDSLITADDYNYTTLTEFVMVYLSKNDISNFSIIGYSMGGYVGLNLLLQGIPGYRSLITLATKLIWDKAIAMHESEKLTQMNLSPILEKLQIEHGANFKNLIAISKKIITSIGDNPISKNQFLANKIPITMLLGSNDKMIMKEEVFVFTENLPLVNFDILENQPHNLERMNEMVITETLLRLLNDSD